MDERNLLSRRGAHPMMFQMFAKSAGRQDNTTHANGFAASDVESDAPGAASLRLEKELAVVLARKPKHQKTIAAAGADHDDEAPLLLADDGDGKPIEKFADASAPITADTAITGDEPDQASNFETVKTTGTETRDRWMKSTRRNRRSNLFRKTASAVITLAVTAFIISIVAAILFGLPDGFKDLLASNARTAAIPVNVDSAIVAEPVPIRLRWVSN